MKALVQYFKNLLTEKNQHWTHTLAALTSLTQLLKKDQRSESSDYTFDIVSGLLDLLVSLLETPWPYTSEGDSSVGKNPQKAGSSSCSVAGANRNDVHPLVYVQAMKCIYYLLLLTFRTLNISQRLLQVLLKYLSPESKGIHFFQYSSAFTEAFRDILAQTLQCSFTMKASFYAVESTDVLEDLRFYSNKEVFLQGAVQKCSLILETSDSKKNISKELVNKGLAWEEHFPGCEVNKTDKVRDIKRRKNPGQQQESQNLELDSHDTIVHITNILHGNFVWLVAGEDQIAQAQNVKKILQEECGTKTVDKPQKNDILAARIYSTKELIRARIITIRETTVLVMDIDSGKFYRVRPLDLFKLPQKLNLVKTPALACMVRLADVCPTPADVRVVEVALASLCIICRYTKEQKLVREHKIMSLLPALIRCPYNKLAIQSLRLATILLYRFNLENQKFWQSLILCSLGSLNKAVQRTFISLKERKRTVVQEADMERDSQSRGLVQNLDAATAQTKENQHEDRTLAIANFVLLGNVLFLCPIAKEYFYFQHGLAIVLQALVLFKKNHGSYGAALRTLSNFVHINEREPGFHSYWKNRSQSKHVNWVGMCDSQADQQALEHSDNESSISDDSERGTYGADDNDNFASKGYRLKNRKSLYVGTAMKEFYIKMAMVDFCSDSTHELIGSVKVPADYLAGTLCGMLNSGHEGTIYIGISEKREVVGERLNHDLRDQVRMGIDRILINRIQPSVLHSQFSLVFVPVVDWSQNEDKEEKITHYSDLYVLEISIRPVPRVLYSLGGLQSFYRIGSTTMELSKQDVRQMVVIEEEAWHRDRVEDLLEELQEVRAQLAANDD